MSDGTRQRTETERERIAKLAEAIGLRAEIDAGVRESLSGDRWDLFRWDWFWGGRQHEGIEIPMINELASLGSYFNAAAVLEPGRLHVMRRIDALEHWERWHREGK